jgi:hypothetical protein
LIKGFPTTTRTRTTTTTTKQNVDPAVHFVYSRVKTKKARPQQQKYQPKRSKGPTIYQPFLKS